MIILGFLLAAPMIAIAGSVLQDSGIDSVSDSNANSIVDTDFPVDLGLQDQVDITADPVFSESDHVDCSRTTSPIGSSHLSRRQSHACQTPIQSTTKKSGGAVRSRLERLFQNAWDRYHEIGNLRIDCPTAARPHLVTCTGPEVRGVNPIAIVVNCAQGKSLGCPHRPQIPTDQVRS